MRKPIAWVLLLAGAGALLGGVAGYLLSRSIGCAVDGFGLPPEATCYRVLGTYVSGTTYYTAASALVGLAIGVALGIFLATPIVLWRRTDPDIRMHPLEHPVIWFSLQLLELFVVIPLLLFWVPDPGEWPEAARIAVWVVALVGITVLNYAIRRRFIPR